MFVTILPPQGFDWTVKLVWGTVLDEGEDVRSERVQAAAGPGVAVVYHALYERGGADAVAELPGGAEWVRAVEAIPAAERHLAVHAGHLFELNEHDRGTVSPDLIPQLTLTGTAAEVAAKVEEIAASGVTEVAYQPIGRDIPRELRSFMAAVSG
jgi:5,10-methylenetetrahydromethanopterin reductase